jgi:hypothetical protein
MGLLAHILRPSGLTHGSSPTYSFLQSPRDLLSMLQKLINMISEILKVVIEER